MKRTLLTLFYVATIATSATANVKMPSLFTDGMVLQQKTSAPVWGFADPGERITVSTTWDNKTATTEAAADGTWKAKVETPSFGGPYALIVKGKNTVYINNVMIGEVWLASGQSNMEMPMGGWDDAPVMNGPADIAASLNNDIRVFMVQRATSFKEEGDLEGAWKHASPENTPLFGATCYYFARKLNAELGIPVGIINTSWGGTPVESWIPMEYIKNVPEYAQLAKDIDASIPTMEQRTKWLLAKPVVQYKPSDTPELGDSECQAAGFNDSKWPIMNIPCLWESTSMRAFDGVVWFRKTIKIAPAMEGKDLVISLGPIDDIDQTYFNGELIGSVNYYSTDRVYTVPAAKVKAGKAVIAVRVYDSGGGGGIYGDPKKLKYYTAGNEKAAVSLAGQWKFLPIAEYTNNRLYKFDIASQEYFKRPVTAANLSEMTATCLYNAMVAPIAQYAIAGAIWYQGEANVERAEEYSRTFPLMIKAWREKWGQGDFPFYYVQIAPWNYGNGKSEEIREAQRLSLSVKNSGMASTIDIGDNTNIHPANKVEVGNRLALWAFKNVYGKDVVCSGPLFKSQEIKGDAIYLSFDYADGLNAKGGTLKDFEIAGKDGKYYPATAVIVAPNVGTQRVASADEANVGTRRVASADEVNVGTRRVASAEGAKVKVSSDKVPAPVSVRYLWKNCVDQVTLYNGANLPASSFQSTRCW